MATDLYQRLARHLDNLPGGFPATESGVEQRILRRLFTPEDAELALSLALLAEEPRVIARRAGIPAEEAARRLEAMDRKGLLYTVHTPGKPTQYGALHFVVGIWENQVNNLSRELVQDFDEYVSVLMDPAVWKRAPQLRTIPVGEAVDARLEVLPYERAGELVLAHRTFAVAPCICRRERRLAGEGCDKPVETCLSLGEGTRFRVANGLGRLIDQEQALEILKQAEETGLVLSPGNAKHATYICACCGCCCGVLRNVKRYPKPATLVSSAFVAEANPETCLGCGTCTSRCQMEALSLEGDKVALDPDRCIGCGLCVTTCPSGSLRLARKPESEQRPVPRNTVEMILRLGRARGKVTVAGLAGMLFRSQIDRLLAPRQAA